MQTLSQKARRIVRSLALALGLAVTALSGGAMAADSNAPGTQQAARSETQPITAQSIDARQRASYQAREAASTELKKFDGGDEILIVGPSVVGLVILICILVILV